MALYQKTWWIKLFKKHIKQPKVNMIESLDTVRECLEDLHYDIKFLLPQLEKLQELEKERQVGHKEIHKTNLETQAAVLDKILERYGFVQNDIDINGIRVKQVTHEFFKNAKKADLHDLVAKKQKDTKWTFEW
jgi:hypothetical protein